MHQVGSGRKADSRLFTYATKCLPTAKTVC